MSKYCHQISLWVSQTSTHCLTDRQLLQIIFLLIQQLVCCHTVLQWYDCQYTETVHCSCSLSMSWSRKAPWLLDAAFLAVLSGSSGTPSYTLWRSGLGSGTCASPGDPPCTPVGRSAAGRSRCVRSSGPRGRPRLRSDCDREGMGKSLWHLDLKFLMNSSVR